MPHPTVTSRDRLAAEIRAGAVERSARHRMAHGCTTPDDYALVETCAARRRLAPGLRASWV